MLLVLPPSEGKAAAPDGAPVDPDALSFPALATTRARVLDALVATSARPDALDRLLVRSPVADEVRRNTRVAELPARPALEVYRGDLYEALDAATLSAAARERAATGVVVVSALWGAVRPTDRIPPYRLNICAHLVGLPPLEPMWREVLGPVLDDAAGGDGVVVDLRSSSYTAAGMPRSAIGRTAVVRVSRDLPGRPSAAPVVAKRVRGELARHLLERGVDPSTRDALPEALAGRWAGELVPPTRSGAPATLVVLVPA